MSFVNRPNDCILEPIPWLDDPEEMARLAETIDRYGGMSTTCGSWIGDANGSLYRWSKVPMEIGKVFRVDRAMHQGSRIALNFRVLARVSRNVVLEMAMARKLNHYPKNDTGYWYEVHGD